MGRINRSLVAAAWLGTFVFSVTTFRLLDDHFDRISRGRQIAAYGELPFRDFFDGGYFLTEFSSAALLRLFGDSLLGEVLLNSSFIAAGAAVVLVLARQASRSWMSAWIAMLLAVLAMPRAYDYDKFLFYPLGVLLAWRYVDLPSARRLMALGAGTVIAGLFRHDHGVIIVASAAVALLVAHAGQWRRLARQTGLFVLAMGVTALPALLFIQSEAGLGDAVDQVLTYVRREGTPRFRLVAPPLSFGQSVTLEPMAPPRHVIKVRWAPQADEAARTNAATRYSLRDALPDETDGRTWSYVVDNASPENLRGLVSDVRVEDTSGIDRQRFAVPPEPLWTRVRRAVPLLQLRLHLSMENAQAFLNYLLLILPLMATVMAARMSRGTPTVQQERARVLSLATMCLLLDVFILQPVQVRGGGMAGPVAVLGSWVAGRPWATSQLPLALTSRSWWLRRDWWPRAAVALVLAITVWSESVVARWDVRVWPAFTSERSQTLSGLRALSASPPLADVAPGRVGEIAIYVRQCTTSADRVFTSWYVPHLYFFAQRGFAGAMAATFGSHWSETRFQRRIVDRLSSQSVPLVLLELEGRSRFVASYPLVWRYFTDRYHVAGETDFGNPYASGYQVLVLKDRPPVRTYQKWSLPCFA
jgi:hypothetical protein